MRCSGPTRSSHGRQIADRLDGTHHRRRRGRFGGNLNAFELTKALIRAGAAGVHFEDQLSSAKKCGHLGGKVLVSTSEAINKLVAARLAADVMDVPTVLIARTDADAADLLLSDNDPRDTAFITGERSSEGSSTFVPASTRRSPAASPMRLIAT